MSLLDGVRVLDLSRVLAGPWAGQLLADWGAEVLKVERPGVGDDTRAWGPPWQDGEDGARSSTYALSCNRGKRSLVVDLADPDGAAQVRQLAGVVDVVLENFKPGSLARYGLEASQLREAYPALIVATVTGFGDDGPLAGRPGYDLVAQGMSGLMSLGGDPSGPPMKTGVAVADLMTGMYLVSSVLAALVRRGRTGEGATLRVSLLDSTVAWLANQGTGALATGRAPSRWGNAHPSLAPYEAFEASDGWLTVAVGNDGQFRALCAAVGASWHLDPRFVTNPARVQHRDVLIPALAAHLRTASRAVWMERLDAVGVPCGPVFDVAEALAQPQVRSRGGVVEHPHPALGVVRTLAAPVFVDGERAVSEVPPPLIGEGGEALAARWLGGR